jgi:pilus assembly protein CpaF
VHANSPRDALSRIEQMIGMAGLDISPRSIRAQIASAINLILQVERFDDGRRRIMSISEVVGMESEVITLQEIVRFQRRGRDANDVIIGDFETTGVRPRFVEALVQRGLPVPDIQFKAGRTCE